jgi:hypothetical protein
LLFIRDWMRALVGRGQLTCRATGVARPQRKTSR